jgi:hypothetical protein
MNALATNEWHEANQRHLSAALTWLRLCLERQALWEPPAALPPAAPAAPGPRAARRGFLRRSPAALDAPALPLLPAPAAITDEQVAQAAAAMVAAEASEPPPTLVMLSQRLGLDRFERDVLLLCAAMELDTRIAALCARAQGDPSRPYPTFALALALFDEPTWAALSPERPLRYWRLIEISQPGAQPLTTSPLRADERIVSYLKGLNYLDDRLAPLLVPLEVAADDLEPPRSQQAVVEAILHRWSRTATASPLPAVQLVGPDAPS